VHFFRNYVTNLFSPRTPAGPFSSLRVALIADELTRRSLEYECHIKNVTPKNYIKVLAEWRPDFLFVESAWQGVNDVWKYQLASYPDYPNRTNAILKQVIDFARRNNIPTVFWNKEDDVHYDRFISTASLFDRIYTVDQNCIEKYRNDAPYADQVGVLMFPVQSLLHHEIVTAAPKSGFSCFVGSYGRHIHQQRRIWQDMLFNAFSPRGLDVYDRNSYRKAEHYRYPALNGLQVRPSVTYRKTANVYRRYRFNLNVNTIENSPTMYSRRLIEILAVGGVAITTPSLAVSQIFSEYCTIVDSIASINAVLDWTEQEYAFAGERAHHGAEMIAKQHTWTNRLSQLESDRIF